jgi:ATP-dependent helicase/nuclease subunit A
MTQTPAPRAATAAAWEAPIGPAATQGQKAAGAGLRLPAFMRGQEPAEHALERGTATHRVLQWLDFAHAGTAGELKEQLQALRERRVLSEQEAGLVDEPALHWLMGSEVGALLQTHARQLMRELPFALAVTPEVLPAGVSLQPLDQVMVRGRLDVVVPTEAGLVVVDYKTDAMRGPEDLAALTARHEPQARLYARALHTITQRPVAAVYLVFLAGRRIVRVAL